MKTVVWFGFVLGALSAAGRVILINPTQSATLECSATSRNNIEWYHENKMIVSVNGKTGSSRRGLTDIATRSKVRSTNLLISPVKEEDAGKFTCMVDGKSQEHTLLFVSVSVTPSPDLRLGSNATLHCKVKGLNPESPVRWKRPGKSEHTRSQTVQLIPVALSDAGTWKCVFSHEGESFSQSLNLKVQEPAPTTPAPIQTKNITVTNPPSDAALLMGHSWWVWVAVGVGGLVVVLLLVIVIVLYRRTKRRKRKLHKMKLLKPKDYCQCRPAAAAKPQQGRRREKPLGPPVQPLLME